MNELKILVIMRMVCAIILGIGAVYLNEIDKSGWWWFLVGSVILGILSGSTNGYRCEACGYNSNKE